MDHGILTRAVMKRLAGPVVLNAALGLLSHFVLRSWIGWTDSQNDVSTGFMVVALSFLQFMALAFLVNRIFLLTAERLSTRQRVPKLALQLVSALIYLAFLGTSVSIIFHQSLSAVLAASGIVGLAVGFALRGLLADVFSGIALHLDAGLKVGDWIDVILRGQTYSGRLYDIQWRTVVIADRSSNLVMIPNSEFSTASVVNRSRPGPASEFSTTLPIPTQYERARVVEILENALARSVASGLLLPQPAPYVRVAGLDAANGSLTYRLQYSLDLNSCGPSKGQSMVLSSAIDFLKAANIRLHPPQETSIARSLPVGADRFSETQARLSVLADVPLLAVLTQRELHDLADAAHICILSDGQSVMRSGEDGDSMFVVAEGRLLVQIDGQRIATLWPGECAGEMSLLTGSRRSADVSAVGQTVLLEIPKAALTPILQSNPLQVDRIATVIAKRQQAAQRRQNAEDDRAAVAAETTSLVSMIRRFFRIG